MYRNAICQRQKQTVNDISNSLHDSLILKNQVNFWKTWKSKFGIKNSLPLFINGKSGNNDICEEFAKSFSTACSPNSEERNSKLHSEFVELKASYYSGDDEHRVYSKTVATVELIDHIVNNLQRGKAASVDNLTAEHIMYCHPIIVSVITKLFNLMLYYNYVPNDFGMSLTVPIPKCNNSIASTTDDFRGITISPVISKIFENFLLNKYGEFLGSSDFQFGFKKDSSCNHAVYSVRKSIEYFVERQSTVSVCAIDVSKAFDRVNKYGLFIKLMKRNCPIELINILDSWYEKCYTCIKWGTAMSIYVKLTAGVRHGGILSPALFAVYVNDILLLLHNSKLGCHINQLCCNSFMYADDLLLLSISICDMQKMIDLCQTELEWLDLRINIKKTSLLRIGKRCKVITNDILILNVPITKNDEIRYLGIYIENAATFRCNMHHSKVKYFRCLNGILGKIGTTAHTDVILSLASSFAAPVLLYCLDTACLKTSELDKLNYTFRSIYVKLFSTFDVKIIDQCMFYTWQLPLKLLVHLRCLNFFYRLSLSACSPASLMFKRLGVRERQSIASLYDISENDNPHLFKTKIWSKFGSNISAV